MASLDTRAVQAIATAYQEHLARHASFLAFRSPAQGAAQLLRPQVARAAVLTTSGASSREDVASWLGMGPAARGLLVRTGVLIDDGAVGAEARLDQIVRTIEAVPGALEGVSIALVSKTPPSSLELSGDLRAVRTPLGPEAPKHPGLWPDSASPDAPDQAVFEAAYVASVRGAPVACCPRSRSCWRALAEIDGSGCGQGLVRTSRGMDGRPGAGGEGGRRTVFRRASGSAIHSRTGSDGRGGWKAAAW